MIDKNKIFQTTAVFNGKCFHHFNITPFSAMLYGDKTENIVPVKFKISNNQNTPSVTAASVDYWGWYDNSEGKFTLIFQNWLSLNICFPYGIKGAEDCGKGKAYRLELAWAYCEVCGTPIQKNTVCAKCFDLRNKNKQS